MRLPSFSTIVRTFYTFTGATRLQPQRALAPFTRATVIRSMPSIPFLGSLFGSSASSSANMSYPDKRSDQEWQAVLNKGKFCLLQTLHTRRANKLFRTIPRPPRERHRSPFYWGI
jgi:peptide-methionine (R)-S-oxide reductase